MVNYFCRQERTFGLGNFINCTPTLKALSDFYKEPFPVYFESVGDAFKDSPFIKHLDRPKGFEVFGSYDINSSIPDWHYIFNLVQSKLSVDLGKLPESYIDQPKMPKPLNDKYFVVLRGCFSNIPRKVSAKDPGDNVYVQIVRYIQQWSNIKPVFIGTYDDYIRNEFVFKVLGKSLFWPKTDIREALNYVNHAEFVIGNDTGLVHAASAMKKKTLCMWHKTSFVKNKARNEIDYSFNNHFDNFTQWISGLI